MMTATLTPRQYADADRIGLTASASREARRRTARPSALDDRGAAGATSSSVSVRSGEPNARRNASERLPAPICSPRYSSNTATSRSSGPPASRIAAASAAAGTSSSTTKARSCRTSGNGLTSSNSAASGARCGERVEVELERTPEALEERGMQLADPPLPRARGLARVKKRLGCPLVTTARSSARRRSARRPTSPRRSRRRRCRRRASARPADRSSLRADRRARSRTARCRRCRRRRCGAPPRRGFRAARCGAQRPPSRAAPAGGSRPRRRTTACTPRRSRSPRARPRRCRRSRCQRVSRPNIASRRGSVNGMSVQLEARDLLDQVDLARHVARPPRRHEEPALRVAVEAEPVEDRRLLVRGDLEPEHGVGALGAQPDRLPLRQRALHVASTRPARAGELDDELRR